MGAKRSGEGASWQIPWMEVITELTTERLANHTIEKILLYFTSKTNSARIFAG